MMLFSLRNAAEATGGILYNAQGMELARCVTIDSRKVEKGFVYVAIKGERFDGHDFIEDSYKKGAICCVSDRKLDTDMPYILVKDTLSALRDLAEYYRRFFDIPVVAVTGSVGKTTTKELIAGVLSAKYLVHKTAGNFNNQTGVPQTVFGLREEHTAAVIELGTNHFGEIDALAKIVRPDICVFTNIGEAHIEYLGSRDGILKAKSEMIPYMREGGCIVANGDDDKLVTLKDKYDCVWTYGLSEKNDYYAKDIVSHGLLGTAFTAVYPKGELELTIHVPGRHMIYNALCALAVGDALGMNPFELTMAINGYVSTSGRMDIRRQGKYTVIADAYNASPTSMRSAMDVLALAEGRKVAVLGDMFELGENEKQLHREVGEYAKNKGIDLLICIGELSQSTFEGAEGIERVHFSTAEEAIGAIYDYIKEDDSILVKASHGMHLERVIEAIK